MNHSSKNRLVLALFITLNSFIGLKLNCQGSVETLKPHQYLIYDHFTWEKQKLSKKSMNFILFEVKSLFLHNKYNSFYQIKPELSDVLNIIKNLRMISQQNWAEDYKQKFETLSTKGIEFVREKWLTEHNYKELNEHLQSLNKE